MIDWVFDFIGVCRNHRVRTEWDGYSLSYVCPICERENPTPKRNPYEDEGF